MMKVAFPGTTSGLEGELVPHFGHTPAFTIVEIEEDTQNIHEVQIIENPPHSQGGCMQPVMKLKNEGVTHVVLGGIGQRPLMGFIQVGIEPYQGIQGSIKDNLRLFTEKKLQKMFEASCNH